MAEDTTPDREPATDAAGALHRHGPLDPSKWDEQPAVTGRPVDVPSPNSTFAARAKKVGAKKVDATEDEVEDKSVQSAATKARRAAKKRA